jgi:hypothetical protein
MLSRLKMALNTDDFVVWTSKENMGYFYSFLR